MKTRHRMLAICMSLLLSVPVIAQETDPVTESPATGETSSEALSDQSVAEKLEGQVKDIGETLDQSETAQDVATSILDPIYQAAEWIAGPTCYWIAFMVMVAGVIGFAGQLVLTKFFLLFRGSLNLREIASDALGLIISATGLILTTQAATENSDFAERPVMVLSAAGVGLLLGLVVWFWGQRQEFDAARGADSKRQKAETDSRRTKM